MKFEKWFPFICCVYVGTFFSSCCAQRACTARGRFVGLGKFRCTFNSARLSRQWNIQQLIWWMAEKPDAISPTECRWCQCTTDTKVHINYGSPKRLCCYMYYLRDSAVMPSRVATIFFSHSLGQYDSLLLEWWRHNWLCCLASPMTPRSAFVRLLFTRNVIACEPGRVFTEISREIIPNAVG